MVDMPEQGHLRRLDVVWQRQPLYFITTCLDQRRPLLAAPEVHAIFLDEWGSWCERHGWAVGRYVIMPDHVHFFTMPLAEGNQSLGRTVGKWKEWTAKRILKSCGGSAPLWQPEFFDHLVRSKESFREKWEYVRNNPVRAGLVDEAGKWPYAGWIDFQ
jgi:putative transposase